MSDNPETRRGPGAQPVGAGPRDAKADPKVDAAKGAERVKDEAARATDEVRRQGEEIASSAVEQADRYAEEQKKAGAEHLAGIAQAVERAADDLRDASPELARYAESAASSVNRFSETLKQRNVRELVDDATDFARREPALFFGASVVAGMMLARFLRSHEEPGDRYAGNASSGRSDFASQRSGVSSTGASTTTTAGRPS
jgi:hypothetical protein